MSLALRLRRHAYATLRASVSGARTATQRLVEERSLRRLERAGGAGVQLVSCFRRLDSPPTGREAAWVERIERERGRMLEDRRLLIDGSEREHFARDEGKTIADAVTVSKPPRAARLLYQLVREFKPQVVVELGTNLGISAAYQAAALADTGNDGRLVTLDASPYRLRVAAALHAGLGLANVRHVRGLFSETLPGVLADYGPVHFAYVDGHHHYQSTLDYFALLWERSSEDAIFVFDDIRWSEGMARAWAALRADPRLGATVDLGSIGIGLRWKGSLGRCLPPVYSVLHPDDPSAKKLFAARSRRPYH